MFRIRQPLLLGGLLLGVLLPLAAAQEAPLRLQIHEQAHVFESFPNWMFWSFPLIVATVLVLIAFVVLSKGQPVIYNHVFFAYYSLSGFKSLLEGLHWMRIDRHCDVALFNCPEAPANAWTPLVDTYVYPAASYLLIAVFLWFVLVFPRPVVPWLKNGRRGAVALLLAIPFMALDWLDLVPESEVQDFFNGYVSLLAVAGLGLLIYHAWETDSEEERIRIRLLTATFFLVVFSTVLITILSYRVEDAYLAGNGAAERGYAIWTLSSLLIVAPVLELLGSIILVYAILRYQLLGTELFLKRLTRGTLFAVTIGVVFVIVSNSIEQVFQITVLKGVRFDFLIAGFISAVTMYPVQKGTERVANKLFPQAGSKAPDYVSKRRMEIYEAQLRYALLDGVLKEKELAMLTALRASIEITEPEVRAVAAKFPIVSIAQLLGTKPPAVPPGSLPSWAPARPPAGPGRPPDTNPSRAPASKKSGPPPKPARRPPPRKR